MSLVRTSRALVALSALTARDWKCINAALAKDEADDHESAAEARQVTATRRAVFAVLDALEIRA